MTFTPVTTSWGTNYEAEVQFSSVPFEFPEYDADFISNAYNKFIITSVDSYSSVRTLGVMEADGDAQLMSLGIESNANDDGGPTNYIIKIYSDGTLKLMAFDEWAL